MFFLVKVVASGQKKIVPIKWVKNVDLAKLLNFGVTYYKKLKKNIKLVYISHDINEEPDFTLDISASINNRQPALYKASIIHCFCKFFQIQCALSIIIQIVNMK